MASEPEKAEEGVETDSSEPPVVPKLERSPSPATPRVLSPGTDARWKAFFYENLQPRALSLQEARVAKRQKDRMLEKKREKKEHPDSLSRDWFKDEAALRETRAYLLDKLLPTLVPGVERLLQVAERKQALEAGELEPGGRFDPVNFLGEYLMRHNPSYLLAARPNPYVRGMKAVTEELKAKVPETMLHK